jgi:hypothetical protein
MKKINKDLVKEIRIYRAIERIPDYKWAKEFNMTAPTWSRIQNNILGVDNFKKNIKLMAKKIGYPIKEIYQPKEVN